MKGMPYLTLDSTVVTSPLFALTYIRYPNILNLSSYHSVRPLRQSKAYILRHTGRPTYLLLSLSTLLSTALSISGEKCG